MATWSSHERRIAEEVERSRARRQRFGRWTGLVTNVSDPEGLERVQVRVWGIHGGVDQIPDVALPWAAISQDGGGSLDAGSFKIPPVGASVYVEFEQGIEDFPIVVGTWRGKPVADATNPQTVQSPDGKPYTPPSGQSETPAEVYDDRSPGAKNPTVTVVHKSSKGHAITMEDGDGREKLRIVDRAGQGLEFYGPTSKNANRGGGPCSNGNAARRGARSAFRGDQLPQAALARRSGHARLRDSAGQELMLEGKDQGERVRLLSRDAAGTTAQTLELRSGKGREGILLKDKSGARLEMDPNGARALNLQDAEGNRISMIPGGSLELNSVTDLRLTVGKNRITEVGGSVQDTVTGDDDRTILGNLKKQVIGSINVSSMGPAQATLGGTLQLLVTNAVQPGIPPTVPTPLDAAIDITIAIGGFKVKIPLGDFKVQSLVGSAIIECGATLGVDKVKLGGITATEPVPCGNILVALLNTLVVGLLAHTHPTAMGPSMSSVDLAASIASVQAALTQSMGDPTHVAINDPLSSSVTVEKLHVPSP